MKKLFQEAKLTPDEVSELEVIIDKDDHNGNFLNTSMFEKLFEYFYFSTGLMPYSVAKARTECPDEWIMSYLQNRRG